MTVSGFNQKEIFEMFSLILKKSTILFFNKCCSQLDRVTMSFPLGSTLAWLGSTFCFGILKVIGWKIFWKILN